MALSREGLLRTTTPRTDLVTIPGEDDKVRVRGMTNAEVIDFSRRFGGRAYGDFPLLLWGVIDEDGASMLVEDDLPAIMGGNADRWMPLVAAINRLTGFTVAPKA
jgi:hypothetical protein